MPARSTSLVMAASAVLIVTATAGILATPAGAATPSPSPTATPTTPPAPTSVSNLHATSSASGVELSWGVGNDYVGGRVCRADGATAPASADCTALSVVEAPQATYTDSTAVAGEEYSYAVFGMTSTGIESTPITATVNPPAPSPPVSTSPVTTSPVITTPVTGSTATPAVGTGSIGGAVKDSSGNKLVGATAAAFQGATFIGSATTSATGAYTIGSLAAGSYTVCFSAPTATGGTSSAGYVPSCYQNVSWDGVNADAPIGTPVSVTNGVKTPGINASLAPGGTISGTVTAQAGGAPLAGVEVSITGDQSSNVFDGGFYNTTTAADGTYSARGILPSTIGYQVCFYPRNVVTGASSSGFLPECYQGAKFVNDYQTDHPLVDVQLAAGQTKTGINASLTAGGAISGHVKAGGAAIAGVKVMVFDLATGNLATGPGNAVTAADGSYTVVGVNPHTSYGVCFDAANGTGGASTQGYVGQCWNGVQFTNGSVQPPDDITPISPTGGSTTTGIDGSLATAGAISGTVTAASGGAPLAGVTVSVINDFTAMTATTNASGNYSVKGLTPSSTGYAVCFDPSHATGAVSASGFVGQCSNNVPWDEAPNDVPSGAAFVPVTSGGTTGGINAAILAGVSIAGTVRTGATPLGGVNVLVYAVDSDQLATGFSSAVTAANGTYLVTSLLPLTGGYQVCFDPYTPNQTAPNGGYQGECYPSILTPTSGQQLTGIDGNLAVGGGVSGTVTSAGGGAALSGVNVDITDETTSDDVADTTTDSTGAYKVNGLNPADTYSVCFDPTGAKGGVSTTGYISACTDSVTVTGGALTTVNIALKAGGAITGTVTAATGGAPVGHVHVWLYDLGGNQTGASAFTAADGTYSLSDLTASPSYVVCFAADSAQGGGSASGYLSQCYSGITWDLSNLPSGTTPVAVTAGHTATGINASLVSAAAVSGTVTATTGGAGLDSVNVSVFTTTDDFLGNTVTFADGTYTMTGLPAGTSAYVVCFDAGQAFGGASTTGYVNECYNNKTWVGGDLPAGVAPLTLTLGSTHTGVNASLASGGAIAGTITSSVGGAPVSAAQINLFDSSRPYANQLSYAFTHQDGAYRIIGLIPGVQYYLCVDGSAATGGTAPANYQGQCYNKQPWVDGDSWGPIPAAATATTVTSAHVVTRNVALVPAAGISGVVTDATGGAPLQGVNVDIFDATGTLVGGGYSDRTGAYVASGLQVGSYTVCFETASVFGGASTTGYAPQCFKGQAWLPGTPPSAGATVVVTHAGMISTGKNASLKRGAAINGVVSGSDGQIPSDAFVHLFTTDGQELTITSVESDGSFSFTGLAPISSGYVLCVDDSFDGNYLNECYNNVPWDGNEGQLPSGVTPVVASAGHTTTRNIVLARMSQISGTVTAAADGSPLGNADVFVFDSTGRQVAVDSTQDDGTYTIGQLPAGSKYYVCAAGGDVSAGPSTKGYFQKCANTANWTGGALPATAKLITLGSGGSVVNFALSNATGTSASITGTVTASDASPLAGVLVTAEGPDYGQATTAADGTYSIHGLAPSSYGYTVCFDPSNATGGPSTTGYVSQCYLNAGYNDASSNNSVPLSGGRTATGVNAKLVSGGEITGAIDGPAGGSDPLSNVSVFVSSADELVTMYGSTDEFGNYDMKGLPVGVQLFVCFNGSGASGSSSTGYSSECNGNTPWNDMDEAVGTPVTLASGVPQTINASLGFGAAVAGTVTSTVGGTPITNVFVNLFVLVGGQWSSPMSTLTDENGNWSISGISTATASVVVCFDASNASGPSPTGYGSECYNNHPWATFGVPYGPPASSDPTSLTGGSVVTANAALTPLGAISGQVTDSSSGQGIAYVLVAAFDGSGTLTATSYTNFDGTYTLPGIPGSSTTLCFYGLSGQASDNSWFGYNSSCYNGVSWSGGTFYDSNNGWDLPAGTTPVSVSTAAVTTGIDTTLDEGNPFRPSSRAKR